MDSSSTFTGVNSCTLVTEPNITYLSQYHSTALSQPMSSNTTALLMILSTFQYQAPYINSVYSDAMAQAGRAAFVQVGGQKTQDDLSKYGLKEAHEAGLTDIEMGLVGGAVKTIRNRSLTVKGPKVFDAKTDLTATQNSGTLFIKWEW